MDTEQAVRDHYRRDDLEEVVLAALRGAGVDVDALAVGDLAGLDQLHAGGTTATQYVLEALQIEPGSWLLDVGAGVGGPARLAAAGHGCRVTGIDLSPDFVELATSLTARVGLSEVVSFDVGSATALPYDDASFDRAMLNHVGMNIADKGDVFGEVRRVLKADGRFAVYEQMRIADGDLTYPLPWATDERSSFVESPDEYRRLLQAAGFEIERHESLAPVLAAAGPPVAGALTPRDLFGPGFDERVANNLAATFAGVINPVLMVARAIRRGARRC